MPLSAEQQEIVDAVRHGHSVTVIAVAGSGKTTTAIEAAHAYYEQTGRRALILTFNARLKQETRERTNGVDYIEAHNYHAAALRFFQPSCTQYNDSLIYQACRLPPVKPLEFGMVVMDEAQDLTPDLYAFVLHVLRHMDRPVTVLLGDPFQRIFGFRGADIRYLMDPNEAFGPLVSGGRFIYKRLSISWRITKEMAAWINTHLNPLELRAVATDEWWAEMGPAIARWWADGIKANPAMPTMPGSMVYVPSKEGKDMHYDQRQKRWTVRDRSILRQFQSLNDEFGSAEVVVLGFSMKATSACKAMVNTLDHINWLVLNGEGENHISPLVTAGKQVASTIHKFKGLERDGVLAMVDASVESRMQDSPLDHYNLMYVACTRAKRKLIVVQGPSPPYATLRRTNLVDLKPITLPEVLNVTDLMDYVPFSPQLDLADVSFSYLEPLPFAPGVQTLPAPTAIVAGVRGTQEDVSMIYGTALGLYIEYMLQQTCRFVQISAQPDVRVNRLEGDFREIALWLQQPLVELMGRGWCNVMQTATAILCMGNQLTHYWRQIGDYPQWVETTRMDAYSTNVIGQLYQLTGATTLAELAPRVSFEHRLDYPVTKGCTLRGYADMVVDNTHVVELKVTKACDDLNFGLQVLAYAAMHHYETGQTWNTYVMHAPSGQLFPVQCHVPLSKILELQVNRKVNTILNHT